MECLQENIRVIRNSFVCHKLRLWKDIEPDKVVKDISEAAEWIVLKDETRLKNVN